MTSTSDAMMFNSNTSDMLSASRDQNWKKAVKINPPHAVIFKEIGDDGKSVSQLEITNQSQGYLIFKVRIYCLSLINPYECR